MVDGILEVKTNVSKKSETMWSTMSNAAKRSGKMNTEKVSLDFTIWG